MFNSKIVFISTKKHSVYIFPRSYFDWILFLEPSRAELVPKERAAFAEEAKTEFNKENYDYGVPLLSAS